MKITKENLKENGWEYNIKISMFWETWRKRIDNYYLTLSFYGDSSNFLGRDWGLHIDDDHFMSVGSLPVSTYEQVDEFLRLVKFGDTSPLPPWRDSTPITEYNGEIRGWKSDLDVLLGEPMHDKWFDEKWYVVLTKGEDTELGRDWFARVDNCDLDSVASIYVATYEQIDKLIELLCQEEKE